MFSICRQTHPATGIEHSVSSCFFNNDETCLITAGANILKVFRLLPEGHTKEVNAAGQPIPPKMKLECLATYTLWGNVMSLASVRCPSAGRDLILVSFREAKLSVLQYDPQTDNLITLSMHYFEEDDMKNGWTTHPHIPWIRVDPECRCAVMLLYGKKLAVLPFRKDITNEDGDPLEAKPLDSKKALPTQTINRAPTLASYVIVLKDLDEKIDNILDIQFLHGYYEPTLLLLYEPVRTFAGRTAVRNDTCAMCGVSLNMSARVHPVIWATAHLPFDCLRAVPVQKPLGGCLIMAVNSLIYLNQSVPPYGVSLNSIATHTTNFPLRIQEGVCITLDGSCVAGLGEGRFALSLKGGQLYVLTLLADSVRTVRSFHLDRAAASVLTTCVCDSLLNICPIGDVSMGEPQLVSEELPRAPDNPAIELVACSGRGKNGALTVLQRTVRPQLITAFNLPGCLDMWSVLGEGTEGSREADGTHAYLILTQEDGSMVLQTGQEINEVDNSGFMTGSPTIFAGNLGNNKFMVQVTTTGIRLIKNGVQLQSVQLEWTAAYAAAADPYLCVQSLCNRVLVLALREFRGKDGASSGRLAPTRQTVPHRPGVLRATVYRDLSGLFTPPDAPNAQVKGEFTGKMKGKNVKAEGFKPGAVYELNDEDELLYGGDQTPASMASIMLAEQSKNPGVPRRISRWWKKYLVEVKATYWLFVLRINGNLEIYSLPEMRLSFLVRDACAGNTILADSLESVPIPSGGIEDEELSSGGQNVDADKCRELLVVGVGHKGTRVLMLMRCEDQLMIYQAYKYPRGNLKLRFSRSRVSFPFGYNAAPLTEPTDSYETALLKENVRQCRYFGNVGGYNGVFICGATPYFLFLSARGELRLHPLCSEEAPVPTFAPFNNTNCPQGFLYFNSKSSLRISALPTHLSYDAWWPVRKVPLRVTPHFVTFHLESKTYCLVASTHQPTTSYYKFNGEDKEKTSDNKGDRFPYPLQDRFFVTLFSPVSWEIIPNTRIELDEWEHVTCLKNVCLSYEGTRSGLRGYIAIGTNYNYSEDITSRGRIIIYDIIDVVPEPGQPLTKNRFKELYAKEQKGPVTALTQVLGYLISAVGQKIYIWQLKDNDLVGVAFIDTQIYVHKMLSVKNLVLVADVYKSISLLRYQAQHRTLSLVSRDLRSAQVC
ncbi:hypothetical protein B5X24_HaOG208295 [Helicoverpa armigera]|nr:hypothetical protein B5X24_HaOG208295 [Helicoverpa armigera]